MAKNLDSSASLRPLDVGNVVSTALILYRSHLKSYLGIATRAALWSFLPIVAVMITFPLLIGTLAGLQSDPMIIILVSLGCLIGGVWFIAYGIAKYILHSALISRLAFLELTSQPESIRAARDRLQPLLWKFLRVALGVGLRLSLLYMALYLVAVIIVFIVGAIVVGIAAALGISPNSFDNPSPPVLIVGILLVAVLTLGLVGGMVYGLLWYFSRWMISEVPLAIEENLTAETSINRSWQLTQGSVGRVILVSSVAFLITLPIFSITNLIPNILLSLAEPGSGQYWLIYGITMALSLVSNIFVLPFWQTTKAVIYADLRSRREGIGLRLRQR